MSLRRPPNVTRKDNKILIWRLNHPSVASGLIRYLQSGLSQGFKEFSIAINGEPAFPNACVPVAGIIEHYRHVKGIPITLHVPPGSYLARSNITYPRSKTPEEIKRERSPFDQVLKYQDSEQVALLTQAFIDGISEHEQCQAGVIDGLIWCLNEVMDNVLVHSKQSDGFIMGQYHPKAKDVTFCIYDYGVGIYNSLKNSKHNPQTPIDAISLAVQEGVGDGSGQGNGLFGLRQIVMQNGGRLTITSGGASIMFIEDGTIRKFQDLPRIDNIHNATTIDFQLNLDKAISLQKAFSSIGGFDGFDIRLDDMLQDDDSLLYDVFQNCKGTATRESGRAVRNDVVNTFTRRQAPIILDFTNVATVSSSFIDEFLAKLVADLGFFTFNQIIKYKGMNETVRFLAERSIKIRIHDEWEEYLQTAAAER